MASCGTSGSLQVLQCGREGGIGWSRWATQDEIDQYHESGDLPAHETTGQVPVYACDEHALACGMAVERTDGREGVAAADLATHTHDAGCRLPAGPEDCGVCAEYGSQVNNDLPGQQQSEQAEVAEQETRLDGGQA